MSDRISEEDYSNFWYRTEEQDISDVISTRVPSTIFGLPVTVPRRFKNLPVNDSSLFGIEFADPKQAYRRKARPEELDGVVVHFSIGESRYKIYLSERQEEDVASAVVGSVEFEGDDQVVRFRVAGEMYSVRLAPKEVIE